MIGTERQKLKIGDIVLAQNNITRNEYDYLQIIYANYNNFICIRSLYSKKVRFLFGHASWYKIPTNVLNSLDKKQFSFINSKTLIINLSGLCFIKKMCETCLIKI